MVSAREFLLRPSAQAVRQAPSADAEIILHRIELLRRTGLRRRIKSVHASPIALIARASAHAARGRRVMDRTGLGPWRFHTIGISEFDNQTRRFSVVCKTNLGCLTVHEDVVPDSSSCAVRHDILAIIALALAPAIGLDRALCLCPGPADMRRSRLVLCRCRLDEHHNAAAICSVLRSPRGRLRRLARFG